MADYFLLNDSAALVLLWNANSDPVLELWLLANSERTGPILACSYGFPESARDPKIIGCDTLPRDPSNHMVDDTGRDLPFRHLADRELLCVTFSSRAQHLDGEWSTQHIFAPRSLFLKSASSYSGAPSIIPFTIWSARLTHGFDEDIPLAYDSFLRGARFLTQAMGEIIVWDSVKPRGAYLGRETETREPSTNSGAVRNLLQTSSRPVEHVGLEGHAIGELMIDAECIVVIPVSCFHSPH